MVMGAGLRCDLGTAQNGRLLSKYGVDEQENSSRSSFRVVCEEKKTTEESDDGLYRSEWHKTLVAVLLFVCAGSANWIVQSIIHDLVPKRPLPDLVMAHWQSRRPFDRGISSRRRRLHDVSFNLVQPISRNVNYLKINFN